MSFNLHHIRYFCLFFKNVLLENVLCNLLSSQDSQMHVGSCCSSNCRTFMLVLIERSQTTQSIAVCYVWDCTAADQPAFPRGLPVHC